MPSIPEITIRQTHAKISIQTDNAKLEIKQPPPIIEMHTTPGQLELQQPLGSLEIDQEKAWSALGMGNTAEWLSNIYSNSKQIALQAVARIVDQGNRMAQIHLKSDPIVEFALEEAFKDSTMDYYPVAPSMDNVDIQYTMNKPIVEGTPGKQDFQATPQYPEYSYTPGKVEIYLAQKNSIAFIPPQLDVKV